MEWIDIKKYIPQNPEMVLIHAERDGTRHYEIVLLGGSINNIEINIKVGERGFIAANVTHWARLAPP